MKRTGRWKVLAGVVAGLAALYALQISVGVGWERWIADLRKSFGAEPKQLVVGFLPVTCHLTCPVVDWTTRHAESGALFESKRYSEFPTMCEDLAGGTLNAAFLNAPMAMSLAARGLPIRLVSLGHRDGSAIVVPTASTAQNFADLRGKRVLVPSKSSNQQLWLARLCRDSGFAITDLDLRVCPPPDMPALLESGDCDAYVVGEPFCARAEMSGKGRVLLQVKDSWPGFISCGLVVRQELIDDDPDLIQELVDGIHGSGMWLEQGVAERSSAAEVAGRYYYNQDPELLKFVLSKPVDRVRYDHLTPLKADFEEILELGLSIGMFSERVEFEKYADPRFSVRARVEPIPMPPDDGKGIPKPTAASK